MNLSILNTSYKLLKKLNLVSFITAEFVKVLVRLVRFLLLFSVR